MNTATIQSVTGPGIAIDHAFTDVQSINFDLTRGVVSLQLPTKIFEAQLSGLTTITFSVSGTVYTVLVT